MCQTIAAPSTSCEFGQESCVALDISNGAMLTNACVYALYSFLMLSDARCTIKEILRGLAPAHAITGFLLVLLSTALSVTLFAGREFAGAPEAKLFWIGELSLTGIWVVISIVCVCGHFRWRSRRDRREANHEGRRTSVGPGPESTDGGIQLGEIGVL